MQWEEIDEEHAIRKTLQALREKRWKKATVNDKLDENDKAAIIKVKVSREVLSGIKLDQNQDSKSFTDLGLLSNRENSETNRESIAVQELSRPLVRLPEINEQNILKSTFNAINSRNNVEVKIMTNNTGVLDGIALNLIENSRRKLNFSRLCAHPMTADNMAPIMFTPLDANVLSSKSRGSKISENQEFNSSAQEASADIEKVNRAEANR